MSMLENISKRLLSIASMQPENRNSSLLILLSSLDKIPDYEIIQDQKDLISSIIEDLIAENDADQIAKSKLVFVEDVEEQIAPTKKTRAKKVVTPTAQVESEDLPDFIEKLTLVKDLPEPVKKLIGLRRMQQDTTLSIELEDTIIQVLDWSDTPEGYGFWEKITQTGDLRDFKAMFGNKGEKVDELVMFAEINNFAEEFLNPEESEDLPNFINSEMKIKDLPEKIKLLALQRQKDAGNSPNENLSLDVFKVNGNFDWIETPEGNAFWEIIYADGDLREFKKKYGNKGEGVDALINAPAVKTRKPRTPKTPAVASKDLPDTIPSNSLIRDFPKPVRDLAEWRQANQNLDFNIDIDLDNPNAFIWENTPEGQNFWEVIHVEGDLTEFKRIFGNKGEAVNNITNGFVQFNELLEIVNKQNPPAKAPVVKTQEVKAVEIIFYPPSGGIINIKCDSLVELHETAIHIMKNTKPKPKYLTFSTITSEASYGTTLNSIKINQDEFYDELRQKLLDIWKGKPSFDWKEFDEKIADTDKIELNEKIINDALKPEPKPVKVEKPKPVPVEKPKPVKVATPKPKVTKPKVEDDLSFLNDLDNIF